MPRLILNDPRIPTTFEEAAAFLAEEDEVPLAHNTDLLVLDTLDTPARTIDVIGVRLHSTVVVEMHRDGSYVLDSGGWQTVTTRDRMNRFTPPGVRVWQADHEWFVADRYGERPFEDGMTVVPAPSAAALWECAR